MERTTEAKIEILAWSKYPEPKGTNYTYIDLSNESVVTQLFDHCKTHDAVILPKGWEFLYSEYGLVGLLTVDSKSGWMKDEDLGTWISNIIYQALISGFHPLVNEFGDYDETDSFFFLNDGSKLKVDWTEIHEIKNTLNSSHL